MHILPLHFLIENPLVYLTARGRKRINGSAFEMKHCTVDLQTQKHFFATGTGLLYRRDALAIDFAVKVESKYVGHARYEVEHRHDSCVHIVGAHFVL